MEQMGVPKGTVARGEPAQEQRKHVRGKYQQEETLHLTITVPKALHSLGGRRVWNTGLNLNMGWTKERCWFNVPLPELLTMFFF